MTTIDIVPSSVLSFWQRTRNVSVLTQDAFLYVASAIFAAITGIVAVSADYREWGITAAIAYAVAGLACVVMARRNRFHPLSAGVIALTRRVAIIMLLAGAVLIPLCVQLAWRADGRPGAHAQPEVAVIERAGDRAAHLQDPYLPSPTSVGTSPSSDKKTIDANSFFPYLPGMVPFGLLNALSGPPALTDARVALAGFTLIVAAIALLASDATVSRRGRALQFLIVLPSGALPMVTGGDDLPVLALMFLGLVLAVRARPVLAGLALGVAGTLKFTAWPLLILLAFAARDREGRPAPLRYSLSVALVVVPVLGAGIIASPSAFFDNVVRFPLGLAKLSSPAASPLFGQVLVHLFPDHRRLVTIALVLVGLFIAVAVFHRWHPRTPVALARYVAFAMALATILAPATRFGYLIYPANLLVWAYVLDGMSAPRLDEVPSVDHLAFN